MLEEADGRGRVPVILKLRIHGREGSEEEEGQLQQGSAEDGNEQ